MGLPEIIETKYTLTGATKIFRCRLIEREPALAVVLFVSFRVTQVDTLTLPAGTVTLGYFWTQRPYNVYHWLTPSGVTVGLYVNLCDRVEISADALDWRDLVLDVLLPLGEPARVLDRDELPDTLDPGLRQYIESACQSVLASADQLRREIETRSRLIWPRLYERGLR